LATMEPGAMATAEMMATMEPGAMATADMMATMEPGAMSDDMMWHDVTSMGGLVLTFGYEDGCLTVNGARILAKVNASNGTIYVIDQVLTSDMAMATMEPGTMATQDMTMSTMEAPMATMEATEAP
jgi:hypothetical protein